MQGSFAVVRSYGDEPLIRRVWEVTDRGVYIHDESNYAAHKAGELYLDPVGFPWADVFEYDADQFAAVEKERPFPWDKLKAYRVQASA